jgi:four helix bundle protein
MQDFRRVDVWHRAHAFSLEIRGLVKTFPRAGCSDLKEQLVRAADSIPSNIVEGCGAATRKELARYLDISIKSAFEVDYRLQVARDSKLLAYAKWCELTAEVIEIRKMLFAFRRTVLAADKAAEEEERDLKRRRRRRKLDEPEDPDANVRRTDD